MKKGIIRLLSICMILFVFIVMIGTVCYADGGLSEQVSEGQSTNGYMIKQDGSLWTWGMNMYGELGTNTVSVASGAHSKNPVKIMDNVVKAGISSSNGYALKSDGTFWTWGANSSAQIGSENVQGTGTLQREPLQIANDVIDGGLSVQRPRGQSTNGYIIKRDGSLWTWGMNTYGELGTNTVSVGSSTHSKIPVKIMDNVVKAGINTSNGYALKSDGTFWTWGANNSAQIGSENAQGAGTLQREPLKIANDVIDGSMSEPVSEGQSTNGYIIKRDGSLWTWGMNIYGELGTNTVSVAPGAHSKNPVKILDNVVKAGISSSNGYALKSDGTFWTWGANSSAQIGSENVQGTGTLQREPLQIANDVIDGGLSVQRPGGQSMNGYIVKRDGSLWTWGMNTHGELGTNTVSVGPGTYSKNPVKIMDNVVKAGITSSNGYALKSDGTFWTWGANSSAQIGSENVQDAGTLQRQPIKIADNVAIPACSAIHVFGDWVATTPATCTKSGIEKRTCTICGTEETREISARGHALAHFDAVEATLETEGNLEYWKCNVCGKFFIDSSGVIEVSADDVILPRKVKLGDANGNGEVDMIDATVIQRAVTMVPVPYDEDQLMNADVDDDGDLTVMDAAFIQRHATMIKTPYPIGELIR